MNNMKRQNDRILKEKVPPIRCRICYWRSVKKKLQKERRDGAKAKMNPFVDVTGDRSKV